jgi:hypothetical protein
MARFTKNVGAGTLVLEVTTFSQDLDSNSSRIAVKLSLQSTTRTAKSTGPVNYLMTIAGVQYRGTFTFDFSKYNSVDVFFNNNIRLNHSADGSKSFFTAGQIADSNTAITGGQAEGSYSPGDIPPQPIVNLRMVSNTDDQLVMAWAPNPDGSSPSNYQIQISKNENYSGYAERNTSGTTWTWNDLDPYTLYYVRVQAQNASGGAVWAGYYFRTDVGIPGIPTTLRSSQVTPGSVRIDWNDPVYVGGQAPTGAQVRYSTTASFADAQYATVNSTENQTTITSLRGATRYFVSVRVKNAAGWGGWSSTFNVSTLPSNPPSVAVTPGISGRNASVRLTPPSGASGVTLWTVRVYDSVTKTTKTFTSTSSTLTINALVAGRRYSFAGAATFKTYTSPFSSAVTVTMPAPTGEPGSYFDGAQGATADQTTAWNGTADASTSRLLGRSVVGWQATQVGGRQSVLVRVTGGRSSSTGYAAQRNAITDFNAAPNSFFISMVESSAALASVEPESIYAFSIYINTPKNISLGLRVRWFRADYTLISAVITQGTYYRGESGWQRIIRNLKSPVGAKYAAFGVTDSQILADGEVASWSAGRGTVSNYRVNGVITRQNRVWNPSAETDSPGIINHTGSVITLVEDVETGRFGRRSYQMKATTAGTSAVKTTPGNDPLITKIGERWHGRLRMRQGEGNFGARQVRLSLFWYDANGTVLKQSNGFAELVPTGVFHRWLGAPNASASEKYLGTTKRVNEVRNPNFSEDTNFWVTPANIRQELSNGSMRLVVTGPIPVGTIIAQADLQGVGGFAGKYRAAAMSFGNSGPDPVKLRFKIQAGTVAQYTTAGGTAVNPGTTFRDVLGGFLIPAGTTSYNLQARTETALDVGDVLYIGQAISEEVSGALVPPGDYFYGDQQSNGTGQLLNARDMTVTDVAPSGAKTVGLYFIENPIYQSNQNDVFYLDEMLLEKAEATTTPAFFDGDGGWVPTFSGDTLQIDDAMITLRKAVSYFDGNTRDSSTTRYVWLGATNASASSKTPLTPIYADPLKDPDKAAIPVAPKPPTILDPSLSPTDTWRRYWVQVQDSEVSPMLSMVPTLQIKTGGTAARLVRIRVFANPNNLDPSDFSTETSWVSEQIVSYIPANTTMMIDGVQERVWASVNGGASASADHLLYGTGGIPATWPVLSCGVGYLIAFDVPLDSPSDNIKVAVSMTRRT